MITEVKSELSREMSLFQVTMMGVGMMIGAGPGGILLAFALNGLLAFFSVMTYAELGSALPKAGGGYSYVQESSGGGKVLVIMGFSLIGFEGYEVISNTAEEVIDSKKNVPKGIFYAVIIVITTYLLVAFAAIVGGGSHNGSLVEWFRLQGATGFAEAIGRIFPIGGLFVVLAAIFASTSALNATIYSSTRVSFALGRDGHLPAFFGHISKKTRIPDIALLFSGGITIIIAAGFPIEVVTAGASIFFIFLFNIVTLSGMKIRIERGHELNYGYLMPFFPLVPILSIIGRTTIGIFLFDMGLLAYIIAGSWLLLGLVYYYSHPRREKTERKSKLVLNRETGEEPEGNRYRLSYQNLI